MVDLIRNRGDKSQLSPVEATLLINREDAIVIDVREQGEYAQGHIPNARHIPAGELDRRSKEMEKWKDHPVILCCATGARSNSAGGALKQGRLRPVYNLRGGMMEWQKAGSRSAARGNEHAAPRPHVRHRHLPLLHPRRAVAAHKGVNEPREDPRRSRPRRREEMMKASGRRTVPQIFIGDYHVGGCDDLFASTAPASSTRCCAASRLSPTETARRAAALSEPNPNTLLDAPCLKTRNPSSRSKSSTSRTCRSKSPTRRRSSSSAKPRRSTSSCAPKARPSRTACMKSTLTVTVTAKIGEDRNLFLVEVAQAGIFQIRNVPEGDLEPVMMIGCPNILFPYAREAVSDAVTRAGFQPVLLSPVNFESLYQAQRQQATGDVPVQ
jgi:rhodanese-related sulfurtransferase